MSFTTRESENGFTVNELLAVLGIAVVMLGAIVSVVVAAHFIMKFW